MSPSLCPSFRAMVPQWRHNSISHHNNKTFRFWVLLHSKIKFCFPSSPISSSFSDDSLSLPKKTQLGYDPSEELFGLASDLQPRDVISDASRPRSWFGPNGQYIRELPCPSCRGRGYTPCAECGIEGSRLDCEQCNGKGTKTCHQCLGDCVIWEESIDERPWEKARSISPVKVKEDDEVDNLEIKLAVRRKSKRVYHSQPPEVGLKISRSLKSLNATTGLFSKRMKIIHRDPMLHAQRVAAIKKAKGAADARKRASEAMKDFFRDPENRRRRSISMKGVKFYCKNCGREGHRKHYCPELHDNMTDRRFKCRLCGEKGHNRRTCPKSKSNESENKIPRHHCCRICGQSGHNRRTCHQQSGAEPSGPTKRTCTCRLCLGWQLFMFNPQKKRKTNYLKLTRFANSAFELTCIAIGDGNGRGGHDGIDEPIGAVRQGHVVNPDIGRTEHGDGVTVTNGTEPEVEDRVPNKTTRGRDNVVNPDVVTCRPCHRWFVNFRKIGKRRGDYCCKGQEEHLSISIARRLCICNASEPLGSLGLLASYAVRGVAFICKEKDKF
ncbi:hypothetical protein LguiB_024885 [Lonicera macranthoides]